MKQIFLTICETNVCIVASFFFFLHSYLELYFSYLITLVLCDKFLQVCSTLASYPGSMGREKHGLGTRLVAHVHLL